MSASEKGININIYQRAGTVCPFALYMHRLLGSMNTETPLLLGPKCN